MKVRMLAGISGGRGDGSPWPPQGGILEVDADEGASLCRAHLAVPVAEPEPPVETAVPPQHDVEARAAESAPEPQEDGRPGVNASKADWVQFAVAQGANAAEAQSLSKQQLIGRYGS